MTDSHRKTCRVSTVDVKRSALRIKLDRKLRPTEHFIAAYKRKSWTDFIPGCSLVSETDQAKIER